MRAVLDKYMLVRYLTFSEVGKDEHLNNPGAFGIATKLDLTHGGLPIYGFLAAADATLPIEKRLVAHGIGYGEDPRSVADFLKLVRQAAPAMDSADAEAFRKALTRP